MRLFAFLLLFISLEACTPAPPKVVNSSFYHWQSHLDITPSEYALLDSLGVDRLYLRFFDLDRASDGQNVVPIAPLQINGPLPWKHAIIPTVFITNRSFLQFSQNDLPSLVKKVAHKIRQQLTALDIKEWSELQFDCDWTGRTRATYFRFLELMEQEFPEQKLSATIRLHQIKYPNKTGVPPVDRGMLMCYNMGTVDDPLEENSIFDWAVTQSYIGTLADYPLALDLALPIFAWGVVFRDGHLVRLINDLRAEALRDTSRFKMIEEGWVELQKSTYLQGHYLYQGDRIRLEAAQPAQLVQAAKGLHEKMNNASFTLAYYHLDSTTLKYFTHADFQTIHAALAQ